MSMVHYYENIIRWALNHKKEFLLIPVFTVLSGLLIWQHLIVSPDDLSRVTVAFQTTNGIASVLYSVFVILDLVIF